jgi:1-deoxy-D-xylulose-5-phosphate synthase
VESGRFHPSKPGPPKYQTVFADTLIRLAREDDRIIAITAAMADGTGLDRFKEVFPSRFYDVGIAEQHAVTFAAGLAAEGMKPVPAIYSTFLQRAYDQVVHDVCIQNLDVTLALDRAGLVGADGATHQGFYDFAYLRTLPNIIVMAPKDENELQHMLCTAVEYPGPAALRFPRGPGYGVPLDPELKALPVGQAELLRDGDDALVVAIGSMVHPALEAASELASDGTSVAVLNARFAKPLDAERLVARARRCRALVTVEEHVGMGGFGAAVLEALSEAGVSLPTRCLAIADGVVEHGDPAAQRAALGLDSAGIARAVTSLLGRRNAS